MKSTRGLTHIASIAAALASLATALSAEPVLDPSALGAEPRITVVTRDEDGDLREREAWIADVAGALYIRTTPASVWGDNFDRDPAFRLRSSERELAMRDARVTEASEVDRVNQRFREKYGFGDAAGDVIRFLSGGKKIYRVTPEAK
jgi:hypothetical protein